jgi:hypothetical protein
MKFFFLCMIHQSWKIHTRIKRVNIWLVVCRGRKKTTTLFSRIDAIWVFIFLSFCVDNAFLWFSYTFSHLLCILHPTNCANKTFRFFTQSTNTIKDRVFYIIISLYLRRLTIRKKQTWFYSSMNYITNCKTIIVEMQTFWILQKVTW